MVICLALTAVMPTQAAGGGGVGPFSVAVPGDLPAEVEREPTVTAEAAVASVREMIGIAEGRGEPQVELIPWGEVGVRWRIVWESDWETGQPWVETLVDAMTGRLVDYSTYELTGGRAALPRFTRSEVEAKATEWLERLVPEGQRADLSPVVFIPAQAPFYDLGQHHFRWQREALGYPVSGDQVSIRISARTGTLTSFHMNWSERAKFALPEQQLAREEAERLFLERMPLELVYRLVSDRDSGAERYRILYQPTDHGGSSYLNQAGQRLDFAGQPVAEAVGGWQLVPAPDKASPAGPFDQAAALALAMELTGREEPPNSPGPSTWGPYGSQPTWNFTWANSHSYTEVMIEQETGLLAALHTLQDQFTPSAQVEWKVTTEEARQTAIAFLQTYRPDLAGRVALRTLPDHVESEVQTLGSSYGLTFVVMHRGIPVDNRMGTVEVDMETGAVVGFWFFGEDGSAPLPEPENLIGEEKARGRIMETAGLHLGWRSFPLWEGQGAPAFQLVWSLGDDLSPVAGVDGQTGTVLDWEGRDLQSRALPPADIAGHPAGREIELLWFQGVLPTVDGQFQPDHLVSTGEAIRWLTEATQTSFYDIYPGNRRRLGEDSVLGRAIAESPDALYLRSAVEAGIIRETDFDGKVDLAAPVTRERFALWAVRALGHDRVASMAVRIPMDLADGDQVGEGYANAVAILAGLSLLPAGDDGRFQPQAQLTRGAAAQMIYAVALELAEH